MIVAFSGPNVPESWNYESDGYKWLYPKRLQTSIIPDLCLISVFGVDGLLLPYRFCFKSYLV
jgi:hypothetical protein